MCVGDVCGSGKLFGLQWRGRGEGLERSLSVSESVWVWLICGKVGERVEIIGGWSLCVSDLGGLRLGGDDVLIKCHGLEGEKLIEVRAERWWWRRCALLRVRG